MLNFTPPHISTITRILTGLILALVLSMFIAPGAMAGCNAKGKGKDCPPPDQNPPGQGLSVVGFTGSLVFDLSETDDPVRDCNSESDISNASGDYQCDVIGHPNISINTQGLTANFNKKNRVICNSLASNILDDPAVLVLDDGSFSFGWMDDCNDGSCAIEVRMTFSGSQILTATDNKADALDVVMNGTMDTRDNDPQNGNPFLLDREIFIDTMVFDFKKPGTTRSAGSCTYFTNSGSNNSPQIEFTSLEI